MLSFFRGAGPVGKIIIGAIVFAIILVFALEFRPGRNAGGGQMAEACSVEVRGECISMKEFWAAYGLAVPPYAEKEQIRRLRIVSNVLEGLVERELLVSEAERLGLSASEESIDENLTRGIARLSLPVAEAPLLGAVLGLCQRLPLGRTCVPGTEGTRMLPVKSRKTNAFDYRIYERVVRNTTNRSPREFKEMQQRELVAMRMRALIASRAQISEEEGYLQYENARSTATADIVQSKGDWFARHVVEASDEDVAAWMLENKERVDDAWKSAEKEWKVGCQVVSELRAAFDTSTGDDDKVLLREKVEQAKQALQRGASFERTVRQFSDGPAASVTSSPHCLQENAPEELRQALSELKAGQYSPIVESTQGFHLIQAHGTLDEGMLEKTGRRAVARRLFVQARAMELAQKFAAQLKAKALDGTELASATEALARAALGLDPADEDGDDETSPGMADPDRPKVDSSGAFTIHESPVPNALPGEMPAAKVIALSPGSVETIRTFQGVAVLKLVNKDPATRETFEKDRANVMQQLRQAKGHEALVQYVARLRKKHQKRITVSQELAKMDEQSGENKKL